MERIEKLKLIVNVIDNAEQRYPELIALERYFFGNTIGGGCKCKINSVRARLSEYWEREGKKELEQLENEQNK